MAKKKMTNYMKENLIKLAKTEIALLYPQTENVKQRKVMTDKVTRDVCKLLDYYYPQKVFNNDTLKECRIVSQVGELNSWVNHKAIDDIAYSGVHNRNVKVRVNRWLPMDKAQHIKNEEVRDEMENVLKVYAKKYSELTVEFVDAIKGALQPYVDTINSLTYIDDLLDIWPSPQVASYIAEVKNNRATSLATINTEQVNILKANTERLKQLNKDKA